MKRATSAMLLLAGLAGCVSTESGGGGQYMGKAFDHGNSGGCMSGAACTGPSVPGFQGPWGQPVAMAAPYNAKPVGGADLARAMVRQSVPLDLVQQAGFNPAGPSGVTQAQYVPPGPTPGLTPPGIPAQPGFPGAPNGTPAGNPFVPGMGAPGAVAAVGALAGGAPAPYPVQRTEVRFTGPNGMRVSWYAPTPDGRPGFGPTYLEAPGRYNFLQAAIYRLKLSDIPNRPGVELYPTLEVVPANAKTATFLAHSAVPVTFTEEDFNQVAAGNYLVKVIYLPDPQFQDLAVTGVDEVISTRLEPGVDPIAEAHRRGCILAVVRMGNIDLEAPNTPAMDAPSMYAPRQPILTAPGAPGRMPVPPGLPQLPGLPPTVLPGQPPVGQTLPPTAPPPGLTPPAPPVLGAPPTPSGKAKDAASPASPYQPAIFPPPPGPGGATK